MLSAKFINQTGLRLARLRMLFCNVNYSIGKENLIRNIFFPKNSSSVISLSEIKQKYNSFEILGLD